MKLIMMNDRFLQRAVRFFTPFLLTAVVAAGCTPPEETPSGPFTAEAASVVRPTDTPVGITVPSASPIESETGGYWPSDGWRTASPESQGMDSELLQEMLDDVREQKLNLYSLLIIRHGYLVSETYFGPQKDALPQDVYSVTKSFVSTLVGIAVDRGWIEGVDQKVLDFFPGESFANPDDRKVKMTVEDLLTMRTGLAWTDADADFQAIFQSDHWTKFMLDLPMAGLPGETFQYCSGCSHLLSAIFQKASGRSALDFARENLFRPLGMADVEWYSDPEGVSIGGWGIRTTSRNMAKLGYLYLHGGWWDGRQIVSTEWVDQATKKHTATKGELGYGYQWWTYPSWNAFMALGAYGQTIFVAPEKDLVIVTTARLTGHEPVYRLIEEYIYPAAKD